MTLLRSFLLVAVAGTALVIAVGEVRSAIVERCAEPWDDAQVIDISARQLTPEEVGRVSPVRDMRIAGHYYPAIGGVISVYLGGSGMYELPFLLGEVAAGLNVIAENREGIDAMSPICLRATFRGETWERRLHLSEPFVLEGGRYQGGAGARGGPRWPADEIVSLSFLVLVDGEPYILDAGEVRITRTV